jgi:hypothetical protein
MKKWFKANDKKVEILEGLKRGNHLCQESE